MTYDCIVIGGGVVGASVFDRLAFSNLSVMLIEQSDDVAFGASRANSGIVHAGYDCKPGTQKARFNVRGNELMWRDIKDLNVPAQKCGSLVVAESDQIAEIEALSTKAKQNGVETQILDREEILKIEKNVSDNIAYALFAPTAGVVSPYKLTIAYAERGIMNGGKIALENEVQSIKKVDGLFQVSTSKGVYLSKLVIITAGANCAKLIELAGGEVYDTEYRRGDYFLLDKTESACVSTVIFPLPTKAGKGILVSPTADGNVIYGPTSVKIDECDTASTLAGLDEIRKSIPLSYKCPNFSKIIRVYSGVRSIVGSDFLVKKSDKVSGLIYACGICSPGLTSAPAIAEYIEELVGDFVEICKKSDPVIKLEKKRKLVSLAPSELSELVKVDKRWGQIVCRCEKVTEMEIVEAIHSVLPATTLDAVKRRTRSGMGRCQGGFCSTRIMQILSRELNIPLDKVKKGGQNSEIAVVKIKELL